MEAPERKQLVLGAKKHRLGKCTKDNRRGFIENDIFFGPTDLNRFFFYQFLLGRFHDRYLMQFIEF